MMCLRLPRLFLQAGLEIKNALSGPVFQFVEAIDGLIGAVFRILNADIGGHTQR